MSKSVTKLTNSIVQRLEPGPVYFDTHDSDVTGLLVRTQPTGKKIYHLRYTLPGGERKAIRIGDAAVLTVAQAREAAKQHWADCVKGTDPQAAKKQAKAYTLDGFLKAVYAPPGATNKGRIQSDARTRASFKALLQKRLCDIKHADILRWQAKREADGKAPATIQRDIDALRGVLTLAVKNGDLPDHPLRNLSKIRLDRTKAPRYLSDEELERLHEALDERETELRAKRASNNAWRRGRSLPELPDIAKTTFADLVKPLVLLALHTGLRRGELFNLQWRDIDLGDAPRLTIRGDGAKSGQTRHIPLNKTAKALMDGWWAQSETTSYVFPSPKTGGRLDNVNKSWTALMKRAQIEDFRFHDCRHHFASMLVQKGVDLNTVRELLGHGDLKMTLRYAHLAPDNAAIAVAVLD